MTTLNTSADIISWVLFQAGEPTDGTSDFHDHTVAALNRAYRDIWMGGGALVDDMDEPWLWLKKDPPGVLTLQPVYSAGSAWVTNNNTAVVLSATVSFSLAGRFFKADDNADVFRIATHTAGNANFQLDSVYTGPTNTADSYKAMALEYSLAADVLRIIAPMRVYKDNRIEVDGVDLMALERDYPLGMVESGTPNRFAMVTESKVRFNRYGGLSSTELTRLEYDYLQRPATELADDTSVPLMPIEHRMVLADVALYYLLGAKSDSRADGIGMRAKAGLRAMAKDNQARRAQMSRMFGSIVTRPSNARRLQRVLRTSSGLIIG